MGLPSVLPEGWGYIFRDRTCPQRKNTHPHREASSSEHSGAPADNTRGKADELRVNLAAASTELQKVSDNLTQATLKVRPGLIVAFLLVASAILLRGMRGTHAGGGTRSFAEIVEIESEKSEAQNPPQ